MQAISMRKALASVAAGATRPYSEQSGNVTTSESDHNQ
jgi:hypothetical protein